MSAQPAVKREVKSTTCYMCACRCGINVTVEDGEVRFIQGNPNHPINKGVLCAKGLRHYEAVLAGAPDQAAATQAGRRTRQLGVRGDQLGRSFRDADRTPAGNPRNRSAPLRALHRPRPDAGADRVVRQTVRHAELRRARRLLLGQHGRRADLYHRRFLLGIRRPRSRALATVRHARHRRDHPRTR